MALENPSTGPAAWSRAESPFHPGEQAVQARAGVRELIDRFARRAFHDFLSDQHRRFFASLPFLLLGSLDAARRPWASILFGRPGFAHSPDPHTLRIDAHAGFGDRLGADLAVGVPVGLLGIELPTRRRNRLNGIVTAIDGAGFAVTVVQSFGNCPQYIQARDPVFAAAPESVVAPRPVRAEGAVLSPAATALIQHADTFFVATAAPGPGGAGAVEDVDISHRGGRPGFVRAVQENGATVLTWPDFPGNSYFNTLGNLTIDPRAGLLFIDFATGDLLSLTGAAEIVWQGAELAGFAGAERLLRLRVTEGSFIEHAVPLRWSAPEPAPQLAATGTWDGAL